MPSKESNCQAKDTEWASTTQVALSRLLRTRFGLTTVGEMHPRPSMVRLTEITIEPLPAPDCKLAVELLSAILVGQVSLDRGREAA